MLGSSGVAAQLEASQEGLSFMKSLYVISAAEVTWSTAWNGKMR
jgi:hypothetical protein